MISFLVVLCSLFSLVYAQASCTTDADCDDSISCTIDNCNANVCEHVSEDALCADTDECTTNYCDFDGCNQFPTFCDDYDACTTDSCDSVNSCQHNPTTCDDNNPCTHNNCDPNLSCQYPPCPDCVFSSNNGITTFCNGTLSADTIDTNILNVGGAAKKRGLSQGTALTVNGGVSVSGTLTVRSLMMPTSDGSSSFDLSQGINTKAITCTSLECQGPSSVDSLNVDSNVIVGNTLTTKDAEIQNTLTAKDATIQNAKLTAMTITTTTDPWWTKPPGTIISSPDSSTTIGFKFYIIGADSKLYELSTQLSQQKGTPRNPCYNGKCKTGLTCDVKKNSCV